MTRRTRPVARIRSLLIVVLLLAAVVLVALVFPVTFGTAADDGTTGGRTGTEAGSSPDADADADADAGGERVVPTTATSAPVVARPALEVLASLSVKGRAPKTGYDREARFGSAWFDIDDNGCSTREDILRRDLTDQVLEGECRVLSGRLADPYTGRTLDFVRGPDTSAEVQIDHVVALSNAWQTGAQQLDQAQRVSLANDPINLAAVDGPTNQAKGDADAATWLPPASGVRCDYAARQVGVKAAYALWITPAERDALERILRGCGTIAAPVSTFAG